MTLSGSWRDYGSTDAEILAAIDARFGAGTALASFWRCIYRNGIELSDPGDGLGEYSYTMASGWLYSVGGSTFYPGNGMSDYYLKDGDVLTIRFTLAYGWDVGGSSDRGGSVGYCTSGSETTGPFSIISKSKVWSLYLCQLWVGTGVPAHEQPLERSR